MCDRKEHVRNQVEHEGELKDLRDQLDRQQQSLLEALLRLKEAPEEVNSDQVTAQAESLALKRRRAIERSHPLYPELEKKLGDLGIRRQISEYFKEHPSACECAHEDGARFINWLRDRGLITLDGKRDKVIVRKFRIVLSALNLGLSLRAFFLG